MIIYGSGMYFKDRVVKSHGVCEHCGRYAPMKSYQGKKFGHIYFIPLFPLGSRSQILRECSRCSMGVHIPVANLGPVVEQVESQFKSWIEEVQQGRNEIELPEVEQKANIGILIAGILNDLFCLKQIESLEAIAAILTSQGMKFEHEIVVARWMEIRGDLAQAKARLIAAHQIQPDHSYPHYQIGRLEVVQSNPKGAEEAFSNYLKLVPDDLDAYIELATMYESLKDHPNIIRTYDSIYTLKPELLSNAGMKKLYKTACKKSGIEGKFLQQLK